MSNRKWRVKRITINLADSEWERLEQAMSLSGRPMTDLVREAIRNIPVPDTVTDCS